MADLETKKQLKKELLDKDVEIVEKDLECRKLQVKLSETENISVAVVQGNAIISSITKLCDTFATGYAALKKDNKL